MQETREETDVEFNPHGTWKWEGGGKCISPVRTTFPCAGFCNFAMPKTHASQRSTTEWVHWAESQGMDGIMEEAPNGQISPLSPGTEYKILLCFVVEAKPIA